MLRRALLALLLAGWLAPAAAAQTAGAGHGATPAVQAARTATAILVDGRLDDEAWVGAAVAAGFTQREPDEGQPATERTELRVAYDDEALYIGVRLHDREPSRIARQLARRDSEAEADVFALFLDPHHDHLTGASFSVSAAGVQGDAIIFNDEWTDESWDAVWESAVSIDEGGWSIEMRLPYSQLRFPAADRHTFGINAMRYIQRRKERAWLVHVPRTESGLASRMGHLEGLEGLAPARTLELLPYVVSRAEFVEPDSGTDPFNDGSRLFGGLGLDLKYRVSSNLSVDGTVNPDFGQVEVDPAVVNLTAFETFFQEKRPFFIEGANIFRNFGRTGANDFWGFNRAEPMLFYSRRIGRAPQGGAGGDFVDRPAASTILGAAKLTGKTGNGWSIGALEAVTGREFAQTVTGGARAETEVEPLSNYAVARVQREFGRRAALGGLVTAVHRDLRAPPLREQLVAQAYVGGVDGHLFLDAARDWVVSGRLAGSHLSGEPGAIGRLQQASQRYFGRPDAPHLALDTGATNLSGWTGSVNVNRQGGVHGLNASLWAVSPGFESSDAGFNFNADRAGMHVAYRWKNPKPNRFARDRFAAIAKWYTWNFARELQGDGIHAFTTIQLRNYWSVFASGFHVRSVQSDRTTRGGPSMLSPRGQGASIGVESDGRRRISAGLNGGIRASEFGGREIEYGLDVRYRPAASLEISTGPSFGRHRTIAQYVGTFDDPAAASTFGRRYLFGTLRQDEFSLQTRVNYVVSPKMSFQLYMQPLVSVGRYDDFKELRQPRTFSFTRYELAPGSLVYDARARRYEVAPGPGGRRFGFDDPDFSFKSLRLNAIFRWEWRPGSAMYLVWSEQREDLANPRPFDFGRDLSRVFRGAADDVVLFKVAYWFQR